MAKKSLMKVRGGRLKTREPLLHKTVQYKFAMFLQHFPPREFNREFRNMFIDYVTRHYIDIRVDQKLIVQGIWDLIRVLDEAENYWECRDCDDIIDQYNGR